MHWIFIGAMIGVGLLLTPVVILAAVIAIPLLVYAAVCALLYSVFGPVVLSWIILGTLLAALVWGVVDSVWKKWFRTPVEPEPESYGDLLVRGGSPPDCGFDR